MPCNPPFSMVVVVGGFRPLSRPDRDFLVSMVPAGGSVFNYVRGVARKDDVRMLECAIRYTDVFLPRNHGRDAAAFYHWVSRHYDHMPEHLVFLHGHLDKAYHTTRTAIVSRWRYYVRHPPDGVITLTANAVEKPLEWYGGRRLTESRRNCWNPVFATYNVRPRTNVSRSCCATFIVPTYILRRFPRAMYEELYRCMEEYPDDAFSGRHGFEFVLPNLLSSRINEDQTALARWFANARREMMEETGNRAMSLVSRP